MSKHYDTLETRTPEEREKALMQALPQQIAHAKANAPFFAEWLKDVDPGVRHLARRARQAAGAAQVDAGRGAEEEPADGRADRRAAEQGAPHLHVARPDLRDRHRRARLFPRRARHASPAGFRPGDVVYNTFSYHLTPAGIMMESALRALGCVVVPGGVGNTELQLDAIAAIRPKGYVGTPSFLKILIEKAAELGKDISSIKHAFVGAEALPPSLRQMFIDKGMTCLQSYGTADLGTIAYESEAHPGHDVDEGVIVEIVRPGTGDPVPEGDVGEVVVTTFNRAYPLIRFGTGDMSAVLAGAEPVRPHQHAHQGLDGPRRPAHQGARHVRRSRADRRDLQEASRPRPPAPGDRLGQPGRRHDAQGRGGRSPRPISRRR